MKTKFNFLIVGLVALFTIIAAPSNGQTVNLVSGTSALFETVVNTGNAFLTTPRLLQERASYTVVQVNVTKVSGTVGGTITLLGSLDGTSFVALRTIETQTALPTITAADATAAYHWRINGSPFPFYRVSWTGTGTMNATFTAQAYFMRQ
jgi:hypothetical protein